MQRWLVTLTVLGAILLGGAATSDAADVSVVDGALVVTGRDDVNDVIDVRPTPFGYEVYDARGGLEPGLGCGVRSVRLAYCGFLISRVEVDGGGGHDLIGVWDVNLPVELSGGDGRDFLEGGRAPDALDGGVGDDAMVGGEGNDVLAGGGGNDVLRGGKAADTIRGEAGADVLVAGSGDGNVLLGGDDPDLVRGGAGDDELDGQTGDDALLAGGGEDRIDTGLGSDLVFGVEVRDELRCTRGDRVRGKLSPRSTCRTLASGEGRPTIWPPQASARSAAIPPADPKVSAQVRRPGAAKRTSVCIYHSTFVPNVLVKVRTYTRKGKLLERFKKVMDANDCRSYRRPGPGRKATFARARRRGSSF